MRFLAPIVLLTAALLPAQNTSSPLSGAVHDPTGAPVANAKIAVTGNENGFVRTATTNRDGFFSIPDLTPATFTVSVGATGFKTWRQEKLTINSSEQRDLGTITLTLGQITESVVVTAELTAVNLSTGDKAASFGSD